MPATSYNQIAGQSIDPENAESEETHHVHNELWSAREERAPEVPFGVDRFGGGDAEIEYEERHGDAEDAVAEGGETLLLFLFAATLTPFSTRLLAEHSTYRTALLAYWFNILLLGASLYLTWTCVGTLGLLKDDIPREVSQVIKRRIVIGQALYAFGAALCIINTHWSIAFLVAVQLYYAIARV